MSIVYARPFVPSVLLGAGLSIGAHAGLVALWLTHAETPTLQEELGIQGRELIDLAEIEMIMAVQESELPEGEVSFDSQAAFESPTEREEAKASNDPILAQTARRVKDPELQFKIANPDQEVETEQEATEVPTEIQEDTVAENATESVAAAPEARAGQDEQDQSAAKEQGLTDAERAEITEWQKSLVLTLNANKSYSKSAREARAEGRVMIAFTVNKYGQIMSRSLVETSGWPVLDQSALEIFDQLKSLPPPPSAMGPGPFDLLIPINYQFK